MVALSVLDQSPVPSGCSPADAVRETVALARAADALGYRRYWLAEHHNTAALAGSAPEVLTAAVAAQTSSIRVGAGGVLLGHYSPLKVAEAFRVLHALFPGRVDLGLGRAGADPQTTAALQPVPVEPPPEEDHGRRVAELVAFLDGAEDGGPHPGVTAVPAGTGSPEVWLLGSSPHSAALAAGLGLSFCFAHFITPRYGPIVVADYRRRFRPSARLGAPLAIAAASVVCAPSDAEAERLATSYQVWRLKRQAERGPVPSVEEAEATAGALGELDRARMEQNRARLVVGGPDRAAAQLRALAEAFAVDELVLLTVCHDPKARLRSYELLAEAFGLARGDPPSG